MRAMYLRAHPLCEKKMGTDLDIGCGSPATVVDHIVPINQGGESIESNLQSLCNRCHNRKRATVDKQRGGGQISGERRP